MMSGILRHFFYFILIICVTGYCPQNCSCEGDTASCENISGENSLQARKLMLKLKHLDDVGKLFSVTNRWWGNVRELDISASTCTEVEGTPFLNLRDLQVLGLHVKSACLFGKDIFSGLNELKVLNLSGNTRMYLNDLNASLSHTFAGEIVLPNLTRIVLDGIQSGEKMIYLEKSNFDVLVFKRPLETIEMSSVNVLMADDQSILENFCKTVKQLIARNAIFFPPKYIIPTPCASLRTVDLSGIFIPITNDNIDNADLDCIYLYVGLFVEKLTVRNVFKLESSSAKDIQGVFNLSSCELRFHFIDASFNAFEILNSSVVLHNTTVHSLSVLDFSHNVIQYISPNFLNPSRNLEILNISHNQLGYMQRQFPSEFEIIFAALTRMRVIILSSNDLDYIPPGTFVYNSKLQEVDLSNNKLSSIAFKLNHLVDLKLFNVSGNLLQTIDEQSFTFFSSFQGTGSGTSRFQIDLSNNKFICSCSDFNRKFIAWLHQSPSVTNGAYICTRDNELLDIHDNAVEDMGAYCELEKSLRVFMIAGPLALTLTLTIAIVTVCFIKRLKEKARLNSFIKTLQIGGFKKSLIFLCHCSENRNVADKIMDRLNREMKLLTHFDKNYISIGDVDFRPGFPVLQELIRNIRQCGVVICIVSNIFCQKHWCQIEVREAQHQKKPVIMIMVERVERRLMDSSMKDIFERNTHASWTNGSDGGRMEPDWPKFCQSVLELVAGDMTRNTHL